MIIYAILLSTFISTPLMALETESTSKVSWQTFTSAQGYELKVPSCWSAGLDDLDETGPVTSAEHIHFTESNSWVRPQNAKYMPNGITIGLDMKFKTRDDRVKEINKYEKYKGRELADKINLIVKRYKIESGEAIAYVRFMEKKMRFSGALYCFAEVAHSM